MKSLITMATLFTILIIPFQAPLVLSSEEIRVIKISPNDQRAVVRIAGKDMQVIKVGDSLGEHGRVIEIAEGRVVLQTRGQRGPETVIIRVENGRQRIERMRKAGDDTPALYMPQSSTKGD